LAEQISTSQFHTIVGAGHENVCSHGGQAYQELLLKFFEQHLLKDHIPVAA
jgi:hypothetical protein